MTGQAQDNDALIPLYLGITGHRDIRDEDKPELIEIIKKILEEKRSSVPLLPSFF